ncbi:unnamed protein product, partial [Brassica rapa subsp. narinosa]
FFFYFFILFLFYLFLFIFICNNVTCRLNYVKRGQV